MSEYKTAAQNLVKGTGRAVSHVLALVLGLVLMVAGLAMGVSLVLLPVGVPVGLAGLLVFMWGLFGRAEQYETPAPPPR
jgi:cbb3-type cytochrome oxidase maturation protein